MVTAGMGIDGRLRWYEARLVDMKGIL